ncbi:protein of unknown function [Formivibrio citricus]|uniref:DUF4124 domain-containing protein n=1 Tax=Formivibrio citricus TaxID=83765 RepID=A0A1I5AJR4_9NEIS|nr:DUF4124 domain-containing protein [Formivibrio citricus]SFN62622.1 protein of unknown function [Formivibrio citricus]
MKKTGIFFVTTLLAIASLAAEARLYKWVDENGRVQFSDKPPPAGAKGVSELDQRGVVRKTPAKAASAGDAALRAEEQQKLIEQKRRDNALRQSFSKPEEIDFLRDRQIEAVRARLQTNKLQQQSVGEKSSRLNTQAETLSAAGKPVPDSIKSNLDAARKELATLEAEARKMDEEIAAITARAEADKRRLIELQGPVRR